MWCITLVPHPQPCDCPQLHPTNQHCCRVAPLCMLKVRAILLLMHTVTNQRVVHHASASCTAVWLATTSLYSNQHCCWVARLYIIAKNCEWIDPTYSANLMAWAYNGCVKEMVALTLDMKSCARRWYAGALKRCAICIHAQQFSRLCCCHCHLEIIKRICAT